MSLRVIDSREYIAARRHKRTCFSCRGEIRIGDACVSARLAYDGDLYSTVEHAACNKEAIRLLREDYGEDYPEGALGEYWEEDAWSAEYFDWRRGRQP